MVMACFVFNYCHPEVVTDYNQEKLHYIQLFFWTYTSKRKLPQNKFRNMYKNEGHAKLLCSFFEYQSSHGVHIFKVKVKLLFSYDK